MRKLTIYRHYFTDSDCYHEGVRQTSVGVQVHSTGANNPMLKRYVQPDDGRLGINLYGNSHNRPGVDVCASAYIGKLNDGTVAVYQTLPWDMRCWISGKGRNGNANRLGYMGFEICEDDLQDEQYFKEAVMSAAVNLTAHLCQIMGRTPDTVVSSYREGDALAVMDHSELAALGLSSGHADITHWLKQYGKQMDDFRGEVAAAMKEGVEIKYVDAGHDEEDWIKVGLMYEVYASNGGYTNLRELDDTASASIAQLRNGDRVRVIAQSAAWSKVETDLYTGYVMTQFLREIEEDKIPDGNEPVGTSMKIVIRDSERNTFRPIGECTMNIEYIEESVD